MKNKWSILLALLIPLGELKAIFYHLNTKVDWYLLSDNERYIDNVMEDYGNAVAFITIFAYIIFARQKTTLEKNICKLYFVIACLDLLHLGAYDMQGLLFTKLVLALAIWSIWTQQNLIKKLWFYLWQRR